VLQTRALPICDGYASLLLMNPFMPFQLQVQKRNHKIVSFRLTVVGYFSLSEVVFLIHCVKKIDESGGFHLVHWGKILSKLDNLCLNCEQLH
jgi:hypothetical protein